MTMDQVLVDMGQAFGWLFLVGVTALGVAIVLYSGWTLLSHRTV
jgi:hypothetical protein